MPRFPFLSFIFLTSITFPSNLFAEAERFLETRFSTVHYAEEKELNDFSWRISGKRLGTGDHAKFVRDRVDEVFQRVEMVLGIYPEAFHLDIYLQPKYSGGDIASYSHERRAITVAVDRVTDGVLAHEIAHAVINAYFKVPPPQKVQEILAQYVDRNFWGE